jgi:hypothetical protein
MQNILILSAGTRIDLAESFLEQINLKSFGIKLFTTDLEPKNLLVDIRMKS